jgi:hypothetical protein
MNRNTLINNLIEREGPLDITFNEPKEFGSLKIISQEVNEIINDTNSKSEFQNETNINDEKNHPTTESSVSKLKKSILDNRLSCMAFNIKFWAA